MRASVAVVKGKYTSRLMKTVLGMVKAEKLIRPEDKVLIKPNCVVAKSSSTGHTTDSRVIEDIIEFVKSLGIEEVVVAEGRAGRNARAYLVVY